MLADVEPLVRRDMPNILLSHNPNSFNRAAELGIELSLAGHTHGGQIQVEILDHRLSPARFITDRSEEHTSELQSLTNLVCRLLLEKKKKKNKNKTKK